MSGEGTDECGVPGEEVQREALDVPRIIGGPLLDSHDGPAQKALGRVEREAPKEKAAHPELLPSRLVSGMCALNCWGARAATHAESLDRRICQGIYQNTEAGEENGRQVCQAPVPSLAVRLPFRVGPQVTRARESSPSR